MQNFIENPFLTSIRALLKFLRDKINANKLNSWCYINQKNVIVVSLAIRLMVSDQGMDPDTTWRCLTVKLSVSVQTAFFFLYTFSIIFDRFFIIKICDFIRCAEKHTADR